jgi:hypothetical protein
MYRLELEWKSLGLEISRKTLCNWVIVTYRDWLSFVVKLLTKKLLEQNYIHADETPVQVLNEPGRKNTTMSYMWVYARTITGIFILMLTRAITNCLM